MGIALLVACITILAFLALLFVIRLRKPPNLELHSRWAHALMPLQVCYDQRLPPNIKDSFRRVREMLHSIVGIDIFGPGEACDKLPNNLPLGYIILSLREGDEDGHGGTTRLSNADGGWIVSAYILISDNLPPDRLDIVVGHEFGHALGLDHENVVESIMQSAIGIRSGTFSNKDRKLLRAAYVRGFHDREHNTSRGSKTERTDRRKPHVDG